MKTKKQKLSLEKFQITKLNNLSFIKGGTGDGDGDPTGISKNAEDCQIHQSEDPQDCQGTGTN